MMTMSLMAILLVANVATIAGQTIAFGTLQATLEGAILGLNVAAIQDPTTYQYHALQRTSQQQVGVDSFSDDKLVQVLYSVLHLLLHICRPQHHYGGDPRFDATNFPTWLTSTHRDQIKVDRWHGIECDSNRRVMNIRQLQHCSIMGKRKERHNDESSKKAFIFHKKKKKKHKTSSHRIKKEDTEEPPEPLEQQGQADTQNNPIPENNNLSSSSSSSNNHRPRSQSTGSISLTYADLVSRVIRPSFSIFNV